MKIYVVTTHYLYIDPSGIYSTGNSDYTTPYLYTNLKKATAFISRIIERWKEDGYDCKKEPSDMLDKLKAFNMCIWVFFNQASDEKRVIILDPTLTIA